MPHVYCACGFKNEHSGVKPKFCSSCGGSMEPKPVARASRPARQAHYEEPEELEQQEPEFDAEAVKGSIRLEAEEHDNSFLTVEQLRKNGVSFARGGSPVDDQVRNEVIQGMMGSGGKTAGGPTPPIDDRKTARRVGKLRR